MKENKEKNNKKSFRDVVKEVDELDRKQRIEAEKRQRKKEEAARDEYAKKIAREKIELLKEKQGVAEKKEEVHEEKKKRGFWRKILDFFYFSKWWLFIAIFAVALASYLVYQLATKPRPDLIVLLVSDDEELFAKSDNIADFFEKYISDFNGNGKVEAAVYTMPLNETEIDYDYARGNSSRLSTELQMGEAVLMITNDTADKLLDTDNLYVDLSEEFPDYKDVKDKGFYLADTSFPEEIGYEGKFPKDTRISVRKLNKEFSFYKKMKKTYDKDFPVLEDIINDIGQKKES